MIIVVGEVNGGFVGGGSDRRVGNFCWFLMFFFWGIDVRFSDFGVWLDVWKDIYLVLVEWRVFVVFKNLLEVVL